MIIINVNVKMITTHLTKLVLVILLSFAVIKTFIQTISTVNAIQFIIAVVKLIQTILIVVVIKQSSVAI